MDSIIRIKKGFIKLNSIKYFSITSVKGTKIKYPTTNIWAKQKSPKDTPFPLYIISNIIIIARHIPIIIKE